ncbi:MAG TPA: hypothetical protein PLG90_05600 [Ignavibacteria bacterium]|nr:hypothetical protein [Ignavibacteria bacterium]
MENKNNKTSNLNGENIYKFFLDESRIPFERNQSKSIFDIDLNEQVVKGDEELSKEFRFRCSYMNNDSENDATINKLKKDKKGKNELPDTDLDENKKQIILNKQDERSLEKYNEERKKEKEKGDII